jgi:poly(3-hydroxybutyrate) depolymerase
MIGDLKGNQIMLYSVIEMQRAWLAGASSLATTWAAIPGNAMMSSALEVFAHAAAPRGKPKFGLGPEEIVLRKPFGQLKHFVQDGAEAKPKLLIVAPMSGHFATLLRGTVERMLDAHDVYITDWRDAKYVPMADGTFDLHDYIDYIIEFLDVLGAGTHVLAVCQPSVPVYAAIALMNKAGHRATPPTLTMMGGPIDTRKSPTAVNQLAMHRPFSWFEDTVIARVPPTYAGAGRSVYPGWLQLSGFMSMNLGSHMMSHWEMFKHLVAGDDDSADTIQDFYEEYRSVCDMTAEFYLQTIDQVFQRHLLPKGEMLHRGERIDPQAITRTALLAIEGERDDISGVGQTQAALDCATGLAADMKHYHLAQGAGHYGLFNGSKWRTQIASVVENWIARHA